MQQGTVGVESGWGGGGGASVFVLHGVWCQSGLVSVMKYWGGSV